MCPTCFQCLSNKDIDGFTDYSLHWENMAVSRIERGKRWLTLLKWSYKVSNTRGEAVLDPELGYLPVSMKLQTAGSDDGLVQEIECQWKFHEISEDSAEHSGVYLPDKVTYRMFKKSELWAHEVIKVTNFKHVNKIISGECLAWNDLQLKQGRVVEVMRDARSDMLEWNGSELVELKPKILNPVFPSSDNLSKDVSWGLSAKIFVVINFLLVVFGIFYLWKNQLGSSK